MAVVQEFRTELRYWGGTWSALEESSDLPLRMQRGETLAGIQIRTVTRTVTTTDWTEVVPPAELTVAALTP